MCSSLVGEIMITYGRSSRLAPTETLVYNTHKVYIMGTISTRVPEELETELEAYLEAERLDRSTAVRKLLAEGLEEWRIEQALERFTEGDVSLSKAAELADLSVWEFTRLVEESDAAWVSGEHLEADLDKL